MLPTNVNCVYLGDRSFLAAVGGDPRARMPVFIHPEGIRDPWYHQFALWNSIGPADRGGQGGGLDHLRGAARRRPGLKSVIAHGGGYFATCMGRLDRKIEKAETRVNIGHKKPSYYLRHFLLRHLRVRSARARDVVLFRRVGARPHSCSAADYPVGGKPIRSASGRRRLKLSNEDFVHGGPLPAPRAGCWASKRSGNCDDPSTQRVG